MDILRVLSAPDLEVRKKTLNIALDLVSSRNIEEVWLMHVLFAFEVPDVFWECTHISHAIII